MDPANVPAIFKVGLTGGIGSGKSEVASRFKNAGILVIDLDDLAKQLMNENLPLQERMAQVLEIPFNEEQGLDRKKAREILFSDKEKKAEIEKLIHPIVRNEFEHRAQLAAEHGHKMIICEAALLYEAGYGESLDEILLIVADEKERIRRIVERDGVSPKLAGSIIDSQAKDSAKKSIAHHTLENHGNLAKLDTFVHECLERWHVLGWINSTENEPQ